uniref:chromophore lyase CpcT/CpeT n=1 Tax=Trichocoleus desertorum TaxID=1481672 RepID=UPI0025B49CA7|nr:chromophore lyase CpcT/CpeT [Trichocoleus desertorum]
MQFSPELVALAHCLCGEFDNQKQAIAEPARFVHLRLWQRPISLFSEDSITLFAEQANIVNLDQPYRQRVMRLQQVQHTDLQVQYYIPRSPGAVRGFGANPALLQTLTSEQIELLPGCTLQIKIKTLEPQGYHFSASLLPSARCCFTYQNETRQVSLGFEATPEMFLSYDKGIDPTTGQVLWGAVWGPYEFTKRQDFASELAL